MKLDEIEDLTYQLYTYGIGDWLTPGGDETKAIEYGHAVQKLIEVAKAAKELIGPDNIGKTVDISIKWDGAISAIMHGQALWDVKQNLEDLERE